MQTYQELCQLIRNALAVAPGGRPRLAVKGYRNSAGEVRDLQVQFVGRAGYELLVRASLEVLENLPVDPRIDESAWVIARDEQRASWKQTLARVQGETSEEAAWETQQFGPDNWFIRLLNLENVGEPAAPCIDNCRTPVTAAKKLIQAAAPIGAFVGIMKLEPGKFTAVETI